MCPAGGSGSCSLSSHSLPPPFLSSYLLLTSSRGTVLSPVCSVNCLFSGMLRELPSLRYVQGTTIYTVCYRIRAGSAPSLPHLSGNEGVKGMVRTAGGTGNTRTREHLCRGTVRGESQSGGRSERVQSEKRQSVKGRQSVSGRAVRQGISRMADP